ncbi:MAG: roadblock/LC7 domain-containing protein [Gammaproteobacteria bacterium]|nr:roadblock/LC7 domain-containing protein [Gammaproteobacteria bacterium]
MSHTLTNALRDFSNRENVLAAAVYSMDGLVISYVGSSAIDRERIGALLATYVSKSNKQSNYVHRINMPKKENFACVVLTLVGGAIFTLMLKSTTNLEANWSTTFKKDLHLVHQVLAID